MPAVGVFCTQIFSYSVGDYQKERECQCVRVRACVDFEFPFVLCILETKGIRYHWGGWGWGNLRFNSIPFAVNGVRV